MKYIGHKNINEVQATKVFTVLGYDVFIPNTYCHPMFIYKKGCPIWVNYSDDGMCDVFEVLSEETLYPTLIGIIRRIYPIRHGYYCKPLTDNLSVDLRFITSQYYDFSTVCFNEEDEIRSAVCVESDFELSKIKGFECAKITNILNKDSNSLLTLYDYMFRESNINKYRGLLISFEAKTQLDVESAELLSMVKWDDGKYYYQFE